MTTSTEDTTTLKVSGILFEKTFVACFHVRNVLVVEEVNITYTRIFKSISLDTHSSILYEHHLCRLLISLFRDASRDVSVCGDHVHLDFRGSTLGVWRFVALDRLLSAGHYNGM